MTVSVEASLPQALSLKMLTELALSCELWLPELCMEEGLPRQRTDSVGPVTKLVGYHPLILDTPSALRSGARSSWELKRGSQTW